jgi:hypothetical protein
MNGTGVTACFGMRVRSDSRLPVSPKSKATVPRQLDVLGLLYEPGFVCLGPLAVIPIRT